MTRRAGPLRGHGAPLLGVAIATAAFLWPAVRHFPSRMVAGSGDANLFLWAWWHVPRALLAGRNPLRTDAMFFPVGVDLGFHTFTPAELVVLWPVARLGGWAAAVNLDQLAAFSGAGVAMYFLALRVCGDRRAAFVAAVAFAALPYRFVHLPGHFNLIHTWTLPLGVLAFLRLRERPSPGRAAALGAVAGVTVLTELQYAVFLAVAVGVLAWRLPRPAAAPRLGWRMPALAAAVASAVASPLLAAMVNAVRNRELDPVKGWAGADNFSADALSWFVPPPTHRIWGGWADGVYGSLAGYLEGLAYAGLAVLALAVVGREFVPAERRRGWVALATVAAVASLGPFLQVGGRAGGLFHLLGRDFTVPLPFALVRAVPLLNGLRVPGRFSVLAAMALGVLMAGTLAALLRRPGRWWRHAWVAVLAVTLVEFLPARLPQRAAAVPRPYHAVAASPDPGAVLNIPLQWSLGRGAVGDLEREDSTPLWYATTHHRPIVSGSTSRYPARRLRRLLAIPVYRQVLALQGEPGFADPPTFTAADLCHLGIGFVAYDRDRPSDRARSYILSLDLPVLADDGVVVIWSVPPCRT